MTRLKTLLIYDERFFKQWLGHRQLALQQIHSVNKTQHKMQDKDGELLNVSLKCITSDLPYCMDTLLNIFRETI